ncbi:MAG: sugar transferase, partial [Oscillospiraceae bacterium]|nr:sugar transferase [Oscillospiraceae bacterium]
MFFKRPLGFLGALFGIIILSPLLLFTAAIIKLTMGSPVIFKQQRPGLHGKIFTMYKFRSMKDATDRNGRKLTDAERLKIIKEKGEEFVSSDEERMTWFGNFIRKFSIDELPELFNVLKGDMAFIGPRPLAVIYLPYYTEEEMHRHDVRPGLTGLAQVNGRNSISWEEKFKYDLKYVNKITFAGDVKLFFDTIKTVIDHSDIGQGAEKPT